MNKNVEVLRKQIKRKLPISQNQDLFWNKAKFGGFEISNMKQQYINQSFK